MNASFRAALKRSTLLDSNVLLLRLTGLVALLNVPFGRIAHHANDLVSFNLTTVSRYTSLVIGLALLYLAAQVARKKRSAYWVTITALSILLVLELLRLHSPLQCICYGGTLALLLHDRKDYVVRSDLTSTRRAFLTALGILVALMLFVAAVVQVINRHTFGHDMSLDETVDVLARALVGLPMPDFVHSSRFGEHLVRLLHLAALSSLVLIGLSLFQPLRLRRPAHRSQRRLAAKIAEQYSRSSEDFFKLWPEDKHYFFYGSSFIAYGVERGVAVVLDGPTGLPADCRHIRKAFLGECHRNGWTPAIIHADKAEADAWQQLGLQPLFIGSEALVDVETFLSKVASNKHFRYIRNKAEKEGLSFAYWQPPLSDDQIERLRAVSDSWLHGSNRREYAFIMGYFDPAYLRDCGIGVLMKGDRPTAYANVIPSYVPTMASIDHMRSLRSAPSVSMHFLLMELIRHAAGNGVTTFNLGLAPLSRLEEQADKNLATSLLGIIKNISGRYYSTGGVEQFKNKFQPDWEPRYLVYGGTPVRLANIATALGRLSAYPHRRRRGLRALVITGIIIAAFGYGAFPLAYIFNPFYFWRGLVSGLTEPGQPYGWLFNLLDSASGILGLGIFGFLAFRYNKHSRLYAVILGLAAIACLSELLTDVFVLPQGYDTAAIPTLQQLVAQPAIFWHGVTSLLNGAAFLLSFGLWVFYARIRREGNVFRTWLFVVAAFIGTVGAAIGLLYPASSPSLQRVFILIYSVWLILLAIDAIRRSPLAARAHARRSVRPL